MTRWFDPAQLLRVGVDAFLSKIFGDYSDNREMQAALEQPAEHDYSQRPEIWIDYVADLGDGWDSTYSVAWLLSRPELSPAGAGGAALRRGDVLLMGGDQVYPAPDREEYRDRTEGPYRAALPCVPVDPPALFAIPGNHDWYDGLTGFTRLFCQDRWLGGWKTTQRRSYFAIKLPHDWWLWGIDIQLGSDVDKPQLTYFESFAKRLKPGDRVIVCTAKPTWLYADVAPHGNRSLSHFLTEKIRDRQAVPVLTLSGDLHHYARYVQEGGEEQRITSGGGGAYLAATHTLPARVAWEERRAGKPHMETYDLAARYPSAARSRALTVGALRFPLQNPGFALFMGFVLLLLAWLMQSASYAHGRPLLQGLADPAATFSQNVALFWPILRNSPASTIAILGLLGGCVLMTEADTRLARTLVGLAAGSLHVALFLTLTCAFSTFNISVLGLTSGMLEHVVLFSAEMVFVGGFASGMLIGAVFAVSALAFGVNRNVAFSSQRIPDHKNFLRMHLDRKGELTIYPIGIPKVARRWKFVSTAAPGEAWFSPKNGAIPHQIIEGPLRIPPRPKRKPGDP